VNNKRIGIIGRTADHVELYDGQTILTRQLRNELERQLPNYVIKCVDTYNYKRRFASCMIQTLICLAFCDSIIILLSRNGLSFYLPFLYYMNKIFHRKIYHRVIGGSLATLIEKHPKWTKYLNSFQYNFVELPSLMNKLEDCGLSNVEVSPNFKALSILCEEDFPKYDKPPFRFCTFSRVTKEKGISEAINAIDRVNHSVGHTVVEVDIYGPIDESYREELEALLTDIPAAKYKGLVPANRSVEIIKDYYMLLFPTTWEGEGFPGTLIDAFSAGVPTIATNWNYNAEILTEGKTGFCYDIAEEKLQDRIEFAIKNPTQIASMRAACITEARKYLPNIVVGELIMFMLR